VGVIPQRLLKLSLGAMTALHLLAPNARLFSLPGALVGLVPAVAGIALYWLAARRFKRLGTSSASDATAASLLTAGPFRFSRNPMYLGMVLGLFGYGVLLGTASPFLVVPAFIFMLERKHIRREESQLAGVFGDDYESYRGRVARWI